MNIAQILFQQAQVRPDTIALQSNGMMLSYRELATRAREAADGLISANVSPGTVVAIEGVYSCDYVIAICATLLAGGVCAPLDPNYPQDRLSYMIADAAPALLLADPESAQGRIAGLAAERRVTVLPMNQLRSGVRVDRPTITGDDLAYLLYTSGSTGRPKGVEMTHRSIALLADWHTTDPRLRRPHRSALMASLSFDVSFQEMFSTWATGGTLLVPPEDVRRDFGKLLSFIVRERVERLFLPTAALAALAAYHVDVRSELKDVVCAGEQLVITPTIRKWFRQMPALALHNHYGPTETHVVTAFTLPAAVDGWPRLPPIGTPLPHVRLSLVDETGKPCADGEAGEIVLGGPCVGRGYRNLPAETAARFTPDPYGEPGRVYRTGDLGVLRSGVLHYLGRRDRQIKINGYRVEPGEVEAALLAYAEVSACAVEPRGSGEGRHLAAYIVLKDGGKRDSAARLPADNPWATRLRERLPSFMVPRTFVLLPELPLSPNGKVDRARLSQPTGVAETKAGAQPPDGAGLEELIARIWGELFECPTLDRDANFFDLGGTSIMAALARIQIANRTGIAVQVVDLFASPTVNTLARALRGQPDPAVPDEGAASRRRRNTLAGQAERRLGLRGTASVRRQNAEAPLPVAPAAPESSVDPLGSS